MAQRASAQAENTNRAAGERGGEAPEFEDALLPTAPVAKTAARTI